MDWLGVVIQNSGPTWWGAAIGVLMVFGALVWIYRIGTFSETGEADSNTLTLFYFFLSLVIILAFAVALFTAYMLVCIAVFAVFGACLRSLAWSAKRLAKLK